MKLTIGGVPEHFNYMWHLPSSREVMRSYGFAYEWVDFPGGTGAMTKALEDNELDLAIMLTEGAIAASAAGKPLKILFPFVMSPLLWGVFTSANRKKQLPANFKDSIFAISRFNSGSHLMAKFLAQRQLSELTDDNFIVSNDLSGARLKILNEEADFFLWEKYMTRPLVYAGEFKMVDEVAAPWPSFVFVVNENNTKFDVSAWKDAVYDITTDYLDEHKEQVIDGISNAYQLTIEDVSNWLDEVKYYDGNNYWQDRITAAIIIMHSKGMISNVPLVRDLLY